ncbi:DUF6578 domain-containing protein [Marisediminicola senii]|uniref:DUF6578 domain-containing protein n=1 Tax=Marisediminicola senii TaxID=2711233 RepID=UPI0013EC6B77|nr:DUF6578 domain-containing protein [Marisediminicola senii]
MSTFHYFGTYHPLIAGRSGSDEHAIAEPADTVPPPGPHDLDVWITEWQVAEDRTEISLGEQVEWMLVPMDQDWIDRLFADRRHIQWQVDTYADVGRDPSDPREYVALTGRVSRIDQISVRYVQSEDPAVRGWVPVTGGATEHSVLSFGTPRAHHGRLVGWIVRVQHEGC